MTGTECGLCGRPNPDLAHTAFEYAAAVLSEPLRRAFRDHMDRHGCDRPHGFGSCPRAMVLYELMPETDRVLIGWAARRLDDHPPRYEDCSSSACPHRTDKVDT